MLREYQQALDKLTREQNEKREDTFKQYQRALDKQTTEQNEKFNTITKIFENFSKDIQALKTQTKTEDSKKK